MKEKQAAAPAATEHPAVGRYCVVRTHNAGVHVGTVQSVDVRNVALTEARRIWYWKGAFTLSEISQFGIDPKNSRVAVAVPEIFLTEAIEIIPATDAARATIEECHE